jgi:heme exporter protein A
MLQAHKLSCRRHDQLIWQNLEFELPPGKLLQIVGANGSGKTSLLRILAGLAAHASGHVFWRGKAIYDDLTDYQQQLHYVGHQPAIKNELTAQENLQLTLTQSSPPSRAQALKVMGLSDRQHHFGYQLSQGQKQRLALARLLLNPLPLWILDEPLAGLDAQMIESLQIILAGHIQQGGTVILTTHRPLAHPALTTNLMQIALGGNGHD